MHLVWAGSGGPDIGCLGRIRVSRGSFRKNGVPVPAALKVTSSLLTGGVLKRIAIELNEQKFPNDKDKLDEIVAELVREYDPAELASTMPFELTIGTERLTETEEEIKAFKKVHVLISFPPDAMVEAGNLLELLKGIEGVEYEQSAN